MGKDEIKDISGGNNPGEENTSSPEVEGRERICDVKEKYEVEKRNNGVGVALV